MARRSATVEVTRHPSRLLLLGFEFHGPHLVSSLAGLAVALWPRAGPPLGRFASREA
jgi:hypothetical protein